MKNNATQFDKFNEKGKKYYYVEEYDEALIQFQKGLNILVKQKTLPQKRKILFNIGTTYHQLAKNFAESGDKTYKKYYKKALENYKEALNNPQGKEKNSVSNYHIHYNIGIAYTDMKLYHTALSFFTKAEEDIKSFDKENKEENNIYYAKVYSAQGKTYYRMGENNKSRESFENALQYNKNDTYTQICLAELYLSVDNYGFADEKISTVLNNEKNEKIIDDIKYYAYAKEIEGRIKIKEKKYDEASQCFIKATEYDLDNHEYLLWDWYSQYLNAFTHKQEPTIEDNNTQKNHISREDLHFIIEKLETICDYCERKKDYEKKQIVLYYLGYFYTRSKDYISAIDRLKKCISIQYANQSCYEKILSLCKEIFSEMKSLFCGTSESIVEEQARELIKNIYRRAYNPTLCEWWWNSPIDKKRKRAGFCIITGILLFTVFFLAFYPFFLPDNITGMSHSQSGLNNNIEDNELTLDEKKFEIEQIWSSYNAFKSFSPYLIGVVLLLLLFPKIESLKAGEVELHMSKTPVPLEIFFPPSAIREGMRLG